MLSLTIGLSVITGEVMLGFSTGHLNATGVAVFSVFVVGALALLGTALANINRQSPWAGPVAHKPRAA